MAKKLSLDEYKKIQKEKKKGTLIVPLEVIIILLGLSLVLNIILSNNILDLESKLEKEKQKEEPISSKPVSYEDVYNQEKIDFIDKNIVFVIDGLGDYYYSYDCMLKKVGNNKFTYWAYNLEAAQDKGYKKGDCK